MIIKFNARTRKVLLEDEHAKQIEDILRRLAREFLGRQIYNLSDVDDDVRVSDQESVDLHAQGWILPAVHKVMEARERRMDSRLAPIMKKQFGFEPQAVKLGSLHLVTPDYAGSWQQKGTEVFVHASERPLVKRGADTTVFENYLTVNWEAIVTGEEASEACLRLMSTIFDNDLFDYGFCAPSDQYDSKNIDRSGGGMRAVGLDVSKCLPGFYWGNFFGPFLCDRIEGDVLASVPGCRSIKLASGVLVTNELSPDCWSDPAFIERECAAIDHIGRSLFFEKGKSMNGTQTLFTMSK